MLPSESRGEILRGLRFPGRGSRKRQALLPDRKRVCQQPWSKAYQTASPSSSSDSLDYRAPNSHPNT